MDLGTAAAVGRVILTLPPSWERRTQTLSVEGSSTGSSFATLVAASGRDFDPAAGNTVTISFSPTTARYVRVVVTANTGWPAGQLSGLRVYAPQ